MKSCNEIKIRLVDESLLLVEPFLCPIQVSLEVDGVDPGAFQVREHEIRHHQLFIIRFILQSPKLLRHRLLMLIVPSVLKLALVAVALVFLLEEGEVEGASCGAALR